jgi:hypothetical protein
LLDTVGREMLLRTVFIASSGAPALGNVALPLEITLDEDGVRVTLYEHDDGHLRIAVQRHVDSAQLELILEGSGWSEETPEGRKPVPRVRLRDGMPNEGLVAGDFVNALTFLTDVPISLSRPPLEDAFIAETTEESELLHGFGTDKPFWATSANPSIRTFSGMVHGDNVRLLLERAPGVRLYADAMKLPLAVARFRELWRVLESAFALVEDRLVERLAVCPAATQLKFDRDELERLRVRRGRASHAQSRAKAGKQELVDVERDCARAIPRLKTLVERVILTKRAGDIRRSTLRN